MRDTSIMIAFGVSVLGGCASGAPDPIKVLAVIRVQEVGTCNSYKFVGSDGVRNTAFPEAGQVMVDFLVLEIDNTKSSKLFAFSPEKLVLNGQTQDSRATSEVRGPNAVMLDATVPAGQKKTFTGKHVVLYGEGSNTDVANTLYDPRYNPKANDPSIIVDNTSRQRPFPVKVDCSELP